MGQNPIPITAPSMYGLFTALNITAPVVIKAKPGNVMRIIVNAPGTAGVLTINDNNLIGASNVAGNQILSIGFANLFAGQEMVLKFPCLTGITVSAVTTGGLFVITYN
jgi:hypothetical protein